MDRLFNWEGWHVVKWIFGGTLMGFILLQIWNLETILNYDKKVIQDDVRESCGAEVFDRSRLSVLGQNRIAHDDSRIVRHHGPYENLKWLHCREIGIAVEELDEFS